MRLLIPIPSEVPKTNPLTADILAEEAVQGGDYRGGKTLCRNFTPIAVVPSWGQSFNGNAGHGGDGKRERGDDGKRERGDDGPGVAGGDGPPRDISDIYNPPPLALNVGRALVQAARAERYAMLSTARRVFSAAGRRSGLFYGHDYHRTAKCRFVRVGGDTIGVHKSQQHGGAFYTDLVICGSVWACPVCAAKVQERRREEIATAINWAYANDLQPVMVTLTFPHYSWQKLSKLLDQQAMALQRLRAGQPWKRFQARHGYRGMIRSLELTHGSNGWHPHTHELWFVRRDADPVAMLVEVLKRWESACIRAGLLDPKNQAQLEAFRAHAVDIKGNCSASDYLAKQDDSRHWGADREIAKASTKQGRAKGLHPFGLLAQAADNQRAARLYLSYALAMKGRRQLHWSKGLKDAVGLNDASDEDLAEESRETADCLGRLTFDEWKLIRVAGMRAQVLNAAESCSGWAAVQALVLSLSAAPIS